jgi:sensor histidine kinase regulating citrate/malate metabolism
MNMSNYWFSRFSIKSKLFLITLVSSLFAMLFAFMILFATNVTEVKQKAMEDFMAAANLIANRSTAAVLFDDPQLAKENLASLAKLPDFKNACVYGKQGQLFAELAITDSLCPQHSKNLHSELDQLT